MCSRELLGVAYSGRGSCRMCGVGWLYCREEENKEIGLAVDKDIVSKSGSWFSYGETRLGQGRDNAIEFLKQNPELLEQVENQIYEKCGLLRPARKGEEAQKEEEAKASRPAKAKQK